MEAKGGLEVLDRDHADIGGMFEKVGEPEANRGKVLQDLVKRISTHVAVERAELFPVVSQKGLGGPEASEALERDYKEIERLLVLIERRKLNSPDMPDLVNDLWRNFEDHGREFSNRIAPALESTLSADELAELNQKMESARKVILSHPHPHMLSLGPVSRFTTRMAAVFDRIRDRTVDNRMMPHGRDGGAGNAS